MACLEVRHSLASVASSISLPAVSCDCSQSGTLSDTRFFPDVTRLGTTALQAQFGWVHLTVITDSDLTYHLQAELLQLAISPLECLNNLWTE